MAVVDTCEVVEVGVEYKVFAVDEEHGDVEERESCEGCENQVDSVGVEEVGEFRGPRRG